MVFGKMAWTQATKMFNAPGLCGPALQELRALRVAEGQPLAARILEENAEEFGFAVPDPTVVADLETEADVNPWDWDEEEAM